MERAGKQPEEIDAIILSHIDSDHIGGLFHVLERNWQVVVYVPQSFPDAFKDLILQHRAKVVEIRNPTQIDDNISSLGELGSSVKEQPLLVETGKGIAVITGDAHPGIISILEMAKEIAKDKLYLALGGFHLEGASESELKSTLNSFRQLGVEKVAPGHSTGSIARYLFQQEYQDDYIESGVGRIIKD